MNLYVETEKLKQAAQAIADLPPCKWEGKLTAGQVMLALGEHLDIWPAVIAAIDQEAPD